jgi:SAM-dependent methyltransferase
MDSGSAHFFGALYAGAGDAQRKAAFVGAILEDGLGHTILGFEPCREMYAVLFDRFSQAADIRHLAAFFPIRFDDYPLDPRADAVVASNHWSHLGPAARESLLTRTLRGLRPGGSLVMNCLQDTPLRSDQPWDEVHKRVFGNLVIRHFASSTAMPGDDSRCIKFEYRMEYEGSFVHAESAEFVLRFDSPDAVSAKLAAAGFVDIRLRGGFADTDYDPQLPGFVVVARKPAEE